MAIDIEKYRHYLSEFELTRDQEDRMLRAVAVMMQGCADYLFMSHPAVGVELRRSNKDCAADSEPLESMRGFIKQRYLEAANDSEEVPHGDQHASTTSGHLLPRFQSKAGS